MRLYRTTRGLARGDGDALLLLDLPHPDVGSLLADDVAQARTARVTDRVAPGSVTLLAPVSAPATVVVVGANYRDHVAEAGIVLPTAPQFFAVSAGRDLFTGPGSPIVLPPEAPGHVDYEAELAVVIGAGGKDIRATDAWHHVGGLAVANDVSARDVQFRGMRDGAVVDLPAVRRSKTFPTFKPLGPVVVTPDEFTQPLDLAITTHVNGELRQKGRTSDMLFSVAELVAAVSATITLVPGDLILTGTPAGVGLASGTYLKAGDTVEVAIDGIGELRNAMTAGGLPG
ncbi:fumarylacetoacetate hydrolase family protein [Actinophytocola sp.]|uniref:fumarylacetoacetate hydrolase family protein n=1 Tax=Actinophytocola sp. TaxID=1872138 RepID=UPI002ED846B5